MRSRSFGSCALLGKQLACTGVWGILLPCAQMQHFSTSNAGGWTRQKLTACVSWQIAAPRSSFSTVTAGFLHTCGVRSNGDAGI